MERGIDAETNRAAIWEVDPATGAFQVFASGLRNPNGLTFYPGSDTLWAVVNERDELGPNLVPDYMTSVKRGAFYGWPYSYWGQHEDPRVRPQRPDLVKAAIMPDYGLSSHVAPLGLAFYTGNVVSGAVPRRRLRRRARQLEPARAERLQGRVHPLRERHARSASRWISSPASSRTARRAAARSAWRSTGPAR